MFGLSCCCLDKNIENMNLLFIQKHTTKFGNRSFLAEILKAKATTTNFWLNVKTYFLHHLFGTQKLNYYLKNLFTEIWGWKLNDKNMLNFGQRHLQSHPMWNWIYSFMIKEHDNIHSDELKWRWRKIVGWRLKKNLVDKRQIFFTYRDRFFLILVLL